MAYQFSRKGCFKCGNCAFDRPCCVVPFSSSLVGHIAENCTSEQRLCYNCRQPGHESAACPSPRTAAAKQCYSCGGVGHIQAECPSLRMQGGSSSGKCYVCDHAKTCPAQRSNRFSHRIAVALVTSLAPARARRVLDSLPVPLPPVAP